MQQQKDLFNRRHNDHQHSMTLSTPRRDNRDMDIPSNTIEPLGKRRFRLPFHYLRTWIFSLLALVCLPIGIGLILIGIDLGENLLSDWREVTATVISNDEEGVEYRLENGDTGEFGYQLDDFITFDTAGELILTVSACDLLSRLNIPKDTGSEFTLWMDVNKSSNQSCVPITHDFVNTYLAVGLILVFYSTFLLVRTFHSAGMRPA